MEKTYLNRRLRSISVCAHCFSYLRTAHTEPQVIVWKSIIRCNLSCGQATLTMVIELPAICMMAVEVYPGPCSVRVAFVGSGSSNRAYENREKAAVNCSQEQVLVSPWSGVRLGSCRWCLCRSGCSCLRGSACHSGRCFFCWSCWRRRRCTPRPCLQRCRSSAEQKRAPQRKHLQVKVSDSFNYSSRLIYKLQEGCCSLHEVPTPSLGLLVKTESIKFKMN